MDNQKLYEAVVLGGLISALPDTLPLLNVINCFCCLGIALGGATAVFYLSKRSVDSEFTTPELIQIGLMTGLAGAFISFAGQYIIFQYYGNWQIEWLKNMLDNMEELPPMWEGLYEELNSPEYQGFAGAALLIRSLIMFPVFTTIGAFISYRLMERKRNPIR